MSKVPMSTYERAQRRDARHFGEQARAWISFVKHVRPPGDHGDRCVDTAYRMARLAARHALNSQKGRFTDPA